MDLDLLTELYLPDILHLVAQYALIPVMFILGALIVYAAWCVGSIIVEVFRQRIHFKENVPAFVNSIYDAQYDQLNSIVEYSGMLRSHKRALLVVANNMGLPQDDLFALAKREIELLQEHYQAISGRTDAVAKIAPMVGLMGTLIPLGPGIVAMGQGNTDALASSLLIAFDTTIAGLITAAICLIVTRIRKAWYGRYLGAVEAGMTAILQKADQAREEKVELPHGEHDRFIADSREERKQARRMEKERKREEREARNMPPNVSGNIYGQMPQYGVAQQSQYYQQPGQQYYQQPIPQSYQQPQQQTVFESVQQPMQQPVQQSTTQQAAQQQGAPQPQQTQQTAASYQPTQAEAKPRSYVACSSDTSAATSFGTVFPGGSRYSGVRNQGASSVDGDTAVTAARRRQGF